ncbi:NACHT, LRR and PYD domains-containing protein 3-like [Pseudophryne corroboree]|uniref:NACHT, LRR and PYD domains-containing protein 3-like n=1 Tax=Pseudophryne corroboree TaxID=495146 RepID=UPI003081EC50
MPKLNIGSWNVGGFNSPAKRRRILFYLNKQNIDIAFLQESHLVPEEVAKLNILNWSMIVFSSYNTKARGVVILLKRHIPHEILNVHTDPTGPECEGNRTLGDILYEALQDLTHDDFKRFKDKLSDFSYRGRGPIPRGRLETADYVTSKNLLIDVYGEEEVLDVTIEVLQLIGLMGLAEDLRHKVTQTDKLMKMSSNKTLEDCRLRYVDYTLDKYHVTEDCNARLGETIYLEKRYVRLLLIKNYRDEGERQHEITASGQRHLQIMADRSSDEYLPTTVQDLFSPDDVGISPKTVVLQGLAGIGKTMTSQKIMLDWASGNLYKDKFQFVFYINCRKVNTITGNISLAGYLSNYCLLKCPSDLLHLIFRKSKGILFIVDGFDELKWSPMNDTEVCDEPFQEVSREILLNSLFRKTVLGDSSLIITTRPLSMMTLKHFVKCPRYVEILGFTGNQLEEYFYKFFKTRDQADLAFSTIKDNDTLYTMCAVPIICWIVCTVIKQQLQERLHTISSKTSTSIYLLYLKSLIKYHRRDSAQHISTCIQKLCALANEGVWDQRILFEESDLVRHGLSVSELESVFLNENIFHRDVDTRTCYSFIHLSVQEFFAALYYVLDQKSVKEHFHFMKIRKVKELLKASEGRAHLKLTVRFLFGLSSEKQIQETQRNIGCPISFRAKLALEEWFRRHPSDYHNEILCCLYETQDVDYVERMMSNFSHVKIKGLHYGKKGEQEDIGCRAVAYCLERSTVNHTVAFDDYIIGPKARSVLSPAFHKCLRLCFRGCTFLDKEEDVYQAGASLSGLFAQCQMQLLSLFQCNLTSSFCEDLRIVIESRPLIKLNLTRNNLQDCGVKVLCQGLRHPACALQELNLAYCRLTESCWEDLSSVLMKQSLLKLDLSWNHLQDSGVRRLCGGLRHLACTLQKLILYNCELTQFCCEDISSVITINRSLIKLDLSWNKIQDCGVRLLCEGLRHQACTLQELRLHRCGLTSSCCDDIRSVIIKNHSLVLLQLTGNNIQDSGLKLLSERLNMGSTMQELWVTVDFRDIVLKRSKLKKPECISS